MTDPTTLYDEDFVVWSQQQAEALRSAAHGGSNQRLDWENLAEEIEDLGKSARRELQSQIRRIVHHLLKLEHAPAVEPRRGWAETIVDARAEIEDLILEYLRGFLDVPGFRIAARWNGIYAKHPTKPTLMARPAPGVTVIACVGGAGMTLSFGIAERAVIDVLEGDDR